MPPCRDVDPFDAVFREAPRSATNPFGHFVAARWWRLSARTPARPEDRAYLTTRPPPLTQPGRIGAGITTGPPLQCTATQNATAIKRWNEEAGGAFDRLAGVRSDYNSGT